MNEWARLSMQAEIIKKRYPAGTKVRLNYMQGEDKMPEGLKGTVLFVDDIGQIHVRWENGSTLALNTDADSFSVTELPDKDKTSKDSMGKKDHRVQQFR